MKTYKYHELMCLRYIWLSEMSLYCTRLFIFVILLHFGHSQTNDSFLNYVNENIEASNNYVVPTNNSWMLTLRNNCSGPNVHYADYIIVGAGSAGCILAGRLAEQKNVSVLLLEAGGFQTRFSDIPGLNGYLRNSVMNWGYYSIPQETGCLAMNNQQCVYPRGLAVGGSSVINAIVLNRGTPSDFNTWPPGWSYNDMLPYYKKFENAQIANVSRLYRGTQGPIHVNNAFPPSDVAEYILDALNEKGIPTVDYNARPILSASPIQYTINGNRRDNSAYGYLNKNRENLKIYTHSFVTRILIEKRRAYGVRFIKDGCVNYAYSKKEIILSAGAINTPQLLILSGIGPARELRRLKIPVKNNLAAVGQNFVDHPMFVNLYIRCNVAEPILSFLETIERYKANQTPLTRGARNELIAFINTKNNSRGIRDIELCTNPAPYSVPNPRTAYNYNETFAESFRLYNASTDQLIQVVLLGALSRGNVTLKSNNPRDHPNINPNFFSNPIDLDTMYKGIQFSLSLLQTEALKKLNCTQVGIQPQCEHLRGDERAYWNCASSRMSTSMFHPVGTARMGRFIQNSVVDSKCKVHNMVGLRVGDASVFADNVKAHPMATVYAVAEKLADLILREK